MRSLASSLTEISEKVESPDNKPKVKYIGYTMGSIQDDLGYQLGATADLYYGFRAPLEDYN